MDNIIIYHGDEIVATMTLAENYQIKDGYTMLAGKGGTSKNTTVCARGRLVVSGGTVTDTSFECNGIMVVNSGNVSGIDLGFQNQLELNSYASNIDIWAGSTVIVSSKGEADNLSLYVNSSVNVNGGVLRNVIQRGKSTITLNGGYADTLTLSKGTLTVGENALAEKISSEADSMIQVLSGGAVNEVTCVGTTVSAASGAVVSNSHLIGYYIEGASSIYYRGKIFLHSGALHKGILGIDNLSSLVAEDGSMIDFSLTDFKPGCNAIINDYSRISGTPEYLMTVSDKQTAGTYALAGNAANFTSSITLRYAEFPATSFTLEIGNAFTFHNNVYTVALNGATLETMLVAYGNTASANQLTWDEINGAECYEMILYGRATSASILTDSQGVDLLGLANGDYTWQVRNIEEEDNRQTGVAFSQTAASQEPQILSAETNTLTDVFFANVDGIWGKGFEAMHVGCKDGWTGTLETVNLAGKSRITDIFAGSDDASVLVLNDDSGNGMALFVDDIYSAASGTSEQARLSKIDTIYTTAGNDVIDLTSQSFEFANGVTVYGGNGNDVIWANSKENMLFGEAGDDRMIGGSDADVIIGGIGNDTLHGGGGADIFCFGDDWGVDTVEQLASGSVVLWFNENSGTWDEANLTYTQGDNSVSVFGVTTVELRFGAAEGHKEQYAVLSASGAFA